MLNGFMLARQPNAGHLALVVGPSGVGKDSLLNGARKHFSDNPHVIFPTRTITRPADAGGEEHSPVNEATFQAHAASGQFALYWQAHGLYYGVPKSIDNDLSNGCTVVVNVSRAILEEARIRYKNLTIISIITQTDILAARLRARGRESEQDIQRRLERAEQMKPQGVDVVEVDNSGLLADGIACFVHAIAAAQRKTVQ